jgi:hypothetical protein
MIDLYTINPLALPSVLLEKRYLGWATAMQLSATSRIYVAIDSEKISLN